MHGKKMDTRKENTVCMTKHSHTIEDLKFKPKKDVSRNGPAEEQIAY